MSETSVWIVRQLKPVAVELTNLLDEPNLDHVLSSHLASCNGKQDFKSIVTWAIAKYLTLFFS